MEHAVLAEEFHEVALELMGRSLLAAGIDRIRLSRARRPADGVDTGSEKLLAHDATSPPTPDEPWSLPGSAERLWRAHPRWSFLPEVAARSPERTSSPGSPPASRQICVK